MATRRDQLHSYQFLLQRVVSALVYRKTDPAQSPFRRAGVAVFAGVMLTVLALAVTAAIGLFVNGFGQKDDWRDGGRVIMESETGATYVVLPPSGDSGPPDNQVLYPTLNFASAALLAGTTEVVEVAQYSLQEESLTDERTIPRGRPVGIVGAPNSVPTADAVSDSPWMLCSGLTAPDSPDEGMQSKLFIGNMSLKGKDLGTGEAMLVRDQDDNYLLSEGYRHKITDPDVVMQPLNWTDSEVKQVDEGFIAGLPKGGDIQIPSVGEGIGETDSALLEGFKVGEVFENTTANTTTYRVVLENSVAQITELQANLLKAHTGQGEFHTGSEAAQVGKENTEDLTPKGGNSAPPEVLPNLAKSGDKENAKSTCARFSGDKDDEQASFTYDADIEQDVAGTETAGISEDGKEYADIVAVTPGTGALVSMGANDVTLVTDTGFTYGLEQSDPSGGGDEEEGQKDDSPTPPASARDALGYPATSEEEEPAPVVHMPSQVVSLIPQGPPLSPQLALETVPTDQTGEDQGGEE